MSCNIQFEFPRKNTPRLLADVSHDVRNGIDKPRGRLFIYKVHLSPLLIHQSLPKKGGKTYY